MYVNGATEPVDAPLVSTFDDLASHREVPSGRGGGRGGLHGDSSAGTDTAADRKAVSVVLTADDFGMSPAIGFAIRRLIDMGRLSATSCLVNSPHWPAEADRLRAVSGAIDVGLHFNLTWGRPLATMPNLAPDGRFPSLGRLILRAVGRRIDVDEIAAELERQIDRFVSAFGRLPDFLDGHQHIHALPGVRRAVLEVFVRRLAPSGAWLRYPALSLADICRNSESASSALAITLLAFRFRHLAESRGIRGNRVFRGVRRFSEEPAYAKLFDRYLARIRPGTLIACHPGVHEDDVGDPRHPSAAREEEYAYLASDAFAERLRRGNIRLARLRDIPATR
ncbi:MAG: ChbG/HpnK family deacetylase [Rhodospirillales bacterium]